MSCYKFNKKIVRYVFMPDTKEIIKKYIKRLMIFSFLIYPLIIFRA